MSATVIMGGQYGSEGKGKIAAYLSANFSLAIRTGGPNAGHTLEHMGTLYKLQSIPCAFINPACQLAVGAGGIIDVDILFKEINMCRISPARLTVDPQAVIIEPRYMDEEKDLKESIGSTGKGVGIAVAQKVGRRVAILARDVPALAGYLGDVARLANDMMDNGHKIMIEGTQGFWLSLHHGEYPFVTSRDITAGSLCGEAGIGPKSVEDVILVVRTFPIRVAGNSGPLENEIDWNTLTAESGSPDPIIEYTTVTEKVRRVARFNLERVKRAATVNSATQIALNFVDYLGFENFGARSYSELSVAAVGLIDLIERETGVPVTLLGTGPNNADIIDLRDNKAPRD